MGPLSYCLRGNLEKKDGVRRNIQIEVMKWEEAEAETKRLGRESKNLCYLITKRKRRPPQSVCPSCDMLKKKFEEKGVSFKQGAPKKVHATSDKRTSISTTTEESITGIRTG